MKKIIQTTLLTFVSVAALAQGKVNLINDAASPVIYGGTLFPTGITLEAGLYGGTNSTALFLYSATAFTISSGGSGVIGPMHIVLNAQPNGAPAIPGIANATPITPSNPWFQVRVWDSSYPSYESAFASGAPTGEGSLFQMNPGASIAYVNTAGPSPNSTWVDGPIYVTPEPSTLALAGLATAGMLLYRRRK
jgi:hypothetical protein